MPYLSKGYGDESPHGARVAFQGGKKGQKFYFGKD